MENIEELFKIAEELSGYESIKLNNIPDIDLYMDQVTSFMDSKLSSFKRNDKDGILTKTMINNYVKSGVVPSPIKKKYNIEHMILFIWIYHFKQVLPISDIGKLFNIFNQKQSKDDRDFDIKNLYEEFLKIQNEVSEEFYDEFSSKISNINEENSDTNKLFITVMRLIMTANIQKRMAEEIIDKYFND